MKNSSIEAWRKTSNISEVLAVQYYGVGSSPFGTLVDADFNETLVADSMQLSATLAISTPTNQAELDDRQYDLLNLLLGAP